MACDSATAAAEGVRRGLYRSISMMLRVPVAFPHRPDGHQTSASAVVTYQTMPVLRLEQHLAASPRLKDLIRSPGSWGWLGILDADHPIAHYADADALIPSADLLRFIAEVVIVDVSLSLHPSTPQESPTILCAVDSTFFEVDAPTAIMDKLARTYPEAMRSS